jgi:hypothetical protein
MKTNIIKYTYYLLLISIAFTNCKKDESNFICENNITICESPIELISTSVDTCFDLSFSNTGQVLSNFTYDYLQSVMSNGVVEDEFIFVHHDFDGEWLVYKSNLCNEYYEQGFDLRTIDNPLLFDWNQNDELLLNDVLSFQVWSVNFDGTNLVKITNNEGSYRGPQWCLNDSLIYCGFSPYDSNHPLYPDRIILMDRNGEIVHAFPVGTSTILSAPNGNKILTTRNNSNSQSIGYIDIETKEFIAIKDFEISSGFGFAGFVWLNDEEIIYHFNKQAAQRIVKLNIITLEETLILEEDCENVGSGARVTFANNQEEALMSRSEYRYVANHPDSLYYFREIIKKNIFTGEEWLLNIDL